MSRVSDESVDSRTSYLFLTLTYALHDAISRVTERPEIFWNQLAHTVHTDATPKDKPRKHLCKRFTSRGNNHQIELQISGHGGPAFDVLLNGNL